MSTKWRAIQNNTTNSHAIEFLYDFDLLHRAPGFAAFRSTSPRVAQHALSSIAAGDVGKLALEGAGQRKAIQPFNLS
jgi:hypothetical protein